MSKSLGNFFTVRDVAKEYGYEPSPLSHDSPPTTAAPSTTAWRSSSSAAPPSSVSTTAAATSCSCWRTARPAKRRARPRVRERLETYRAKFIESMDDDLNTADALSARCSTLPATVNATFAAQAPSQELCSFALSLFDELAGVLGLVYRTEDESLGSDESAEIETQRSTVEPRLGHRRPHPRRAQSAPCRARGHAAGREVAHRVISSGRPLPRAEQVQ